MSTAKTPLTPAQELAHQVLDVLQDKRLGHSMWKSGAPRPELDQLFGEMEDKLSYIGRSFEVHREIVPGFASEFAHTLKTEFAKAPHLKRTWDDPRMQNMVERTLGKSLQTFVQDTAHASPKVVIGSQLKKAAEAKAAAGEIPHVDYIKDFAAQMKTALETHEGQLKVADPSAILGVAPSDSLIKGVMKEAQGAVDKHYKAANGIYNTGLAIAEDKQAFHTQAVAAVEQMIQSHPHAKATLLRPQVHEAVEQHLGEKLNAAIQTVAHPEIAAEAAEALARTEGLASVARAIKATAAAKESAAAAAGAVLEKAASKMHGNAKWLVGGAGAAVTLGAVMHLDGKTHAQSIKNRAANPLVDALAR